MKQCYIYNYFKKVNTKTQEIQNHQVIFFPYKNILANFSDLKIQLRDYFHENTLPNKLYIICFEFNKKEVNEIFKSDSELYDYIPKFDHNINGNSLNIVSINKKGGLENIVNKIDSIDEIKFLYNIGLTKIFTKNGGLIVSQPSNHFVFPSGKHSDRFLRTGNVLLSGSEINFIASALVLHFKKEKIESIYSDTSSINSLAYAYINLLKELNDDFKESVFVESFGSYKMFEKQKFKAKRNSVFLISSSTSGSILDRMVEENKSKNIDLNDIAILFGLTIKNHYKSHLICDLTKNENNPLGIDPIKSFNNKKGESCGFCEKGSKALKVEGDVFLLEKPIVNSVLLKKTDLPIFIRNFSEFYKKANKESDSIIRCYHKENGYKDKKYDIYIDVPSILKEWDNRTVDNHPYKNIFLKLEKHILQNIPASLKYLITLPDEGSKELASVIQKVLTEHQIPFDKKNIIGIDSKEIKNINKNQKGTIAVVSSSIVSGRNLLYLSRALRDYEKTYQRIFFNFINRTNKKEQFDFLQSNLGLGEFGVDTHKIFNVETIFCSNESLKTTWHHEYNKMLEFLDFVETNNHLKEFSKYCDFRVNELAECGKQKGLSDNLFFPTLNGKTLKIRNGFAFAPFNTGVSHTNFIARAKQSEVYFIISSILNELRNKEVFHQSEYVRNILDPGNFIRFNDGIIQTCLLRASKSEELDYSLSDDASLQMKSILGDMIIHINDDHAEALNEFFYAIAIRKLKFIPFVIEDCISLLEEQTDYNKKDSILKGLVEYIKENILEKENSQDKFKNLPKPTILNE